MTQSLRLPHSVSVYGVSTMNKPGSVLVTELQQETKQSLGLHGVVV